MNRTFSDRITDVPRSFIREILKTALDPSVISFAGGLPNRELFPETELKEASNKVFDIYGSDILQYGNSEGFLKLREYISWRYHTKKHLDIPVENILITSGSQQGLDILGKILLNEGDGLIIEEPGYLGAIQAFSLYRPKFLPVPVSAEGMNLEKLEAFISSENPKLLYSVPNFQNPSGISYTEENRETVSKIIEKTGVLLIEDDPYGDLRFEGEERRSFKEFIPDNTVLLGSFSKSIIPGFRLGWIAAPADIMTRLITAKQASDLHTSHFTQSIIYQYLMDNDIDAHMKKINSLYGSQCRSMMRSIKKYFPEHITFSKPEGGMFLWADLPDNVSSVKLFDLALKEKVVFVPGDPFYINKTDTPAMRLNFSCVDEETIQEGIKRLGKSIEKLLA
jgi:2-aminoadipate transaminase